MIKGFVGYRFTRIGTEFPEDQLAEFKFHEVKTESQQISSIGFVPDADGKYVTELSMGKFIRIGYQAKKISKPELEKRIKTKVKSKEEELGRPLQKGEKDAMKHVVLEELIPLTFPDKIEYYHIFIPNGADHGKLFVGVPTFSKAEDLLSLLRKATGSLPVVPVTVENDVSQTLTEMFKTSYAEKICLMDKAVVTTLEKQRIIFEKVDLYEVHDEVSYILKTHNLSGITEMKMEWDGIINFTMNDKMEFKGLKADKEFLSDAETDEGGTLVIIFSEMVKIFNTMVKELGGEEKQD